MTDRTCRRSGQNVVSSLRHRKLAAELPGRERSVLLGTLGGRFAFIEQPKKNVIFRDVVFRLAVAQPAASRYGERGGNDFVCLSHFETQFAVCSAASIAE